MPENVNSVLPCAYCGEMPSEGATIIHLSGKSVCRIAGTVFTLEQWQNRPGEDAARQKQFGWDCDIVEGLINHWTSPDYQGLNTALDALHHAWEVTP